MTATSSINSRKFRATFAAPPGYRLSPVTSTTGTGASGEIRPTLPQTNSSSIKSPITRIRFVRARARISLRRREFMSPQKESRQMPPAGDVVANYCQNLLAGRFVRDRLLFSVKPLILNTKAKSTVEEPDDI